MRCTATRTSARELRGGAAVLADVLEIAEHAVAVQGLARS